MTKQFQDQYHWPGVVARKPGHCLRGRIPRCSDLLRGYVSAAPSRRSDPGSAIQHEADAPPFGVPEVLSQSFWGGVWGIVFLLIVPRFFSSISAVWARTDGVTIRTPKPKELSPFHSNRRDLQCSLE